MSLQPLFPLEKQFQGKSGRNLTGGYLMVFLSGTDDPATTYSDYVGTLNPQRIVLDDNGRAVVICDADLYYRLEVYDEEGMLLWTEEPVACTGGGAAAAQVVTVESTDGSVDVTKTVVGSNTYFDLSTKFNPDEPLDWVRAECPVDHDGDFYPSYVAGTMSTSNLGISVVGGRFYHITTYLRVTPDGTGISYDTLQVKLMLDSEILCQRDYDIDSSMSDPVELEFAYDLDVEQDGNLRYLVNGTSGHDVQLGVMIHRIFNGYSSEYAKKSWVGSYFVQNSSLDYDGGTITGISGSPIGGISEAHVSSIASSYAESAASSKLDISAFTSYTASALTGLQQDTAAISSSVSSLETSKVDQSAFDACCSAVGAQVSALSSDVSAIQQNTADISAAVSAVTSQTGNYIPWSASGTFQPSGNYVSSDVFTAYTASALTGIQQDTADISAAVSGLTGTYIQYADLESASGKITGISGTALWGGHEYTGIYPIVVDNTADMISAVNRTLAVDETMTGYASGDSAVIGVNTSTVLSGLTAYQPTSAMTAYQLSGDYAYNSSLADYQPVSGMTAYQPSGNYLVPDDITGKADVSSLTAYQEITGMSAYQLSGDYAYNSAVSSKMDASASSEFYPMTGNPSSFLVADDISGKADSSALTAYQEITGMSAYQPSGDYIYASSLGTGVI